MLASASKALQPCNGFHRLRQDPISDRLVYIIEDRRCRSFFNLFDPDAYHPSPHSEGHVTIGQAIQACVDRIAVWRHGRVDCLTGSVFNVDGGYTAC